MAEKPMPMIAVVKNTWKEPVRQKWDGFAYIWQPGEEKQMSVDLAKHFCGDSDIESPNDIRREKQRVLDMYPLDKRKLGAPLHIVRTIDPNDSVVEEDEEKPVVLAEDEDEEKPFADLEDSKPADDMLSPATRGRGRPRKDGQGG